MTEERRYGPRRLASLLSNDVETSSEHGNVWIQALTADSRAVGPGMLFAALPGTKSDGAKFIPQAVEAGAAAILTGQQKLPEEYAIPVIRVEDPRHTLALVAARYFARQPRTVAAITGTNGKTSVSVFLRQIWERAGYKAASLGTIGLVAPGGAVTGSLTTPDPIRLHEIMADLAGDDVTHLALEASSHGLEQRRLDGVRLSAGGFTNLTRDHLDYHRTLDEYLKAKLRLFDTLLPKGAAAVADADFPEAAKVQAIAKERELEYFSAGRNGETLKLLSVTRMHDGSRLLVEAFGEKRYVSLPLVGAFQVSNAMVAAALAIATGVDALKVLDALSHLKGATGRLELVGTHPSGAQVYVDYAHTPDALASALKALRVHAKNKLVVIFGAGGDRDAGKRPLMGQAAQENADRVIVTDDNPRNESAAAIRRSVLTGAPNADEIADRRAAIRTAVTALKEGDILLIAGKGHETGQTVGDKVLPFSDQDEARQALKSVGGKGVSFLWTTEAFAAASGGRLDGTPPSEISGVSIDSRTVGKGEAFVAIRGENHDGHAFVDKALQAGAALAVVTEGRVSSKFGPLLVVCDDPLAALERIGAASRARMQGSVVGVTGSVGKTGTKEMLRLVFSEVGPTHAPVGSFNNQWGVPLTLARMPAATRYGIFEIGMNHPGEIRPLVKLVRPHVAIVTTVESVHRAYFDSEAAIAEAKAEIFEGLEPGGTAILNRDNVWFDLLAERARACGARIVSFGADAGVDIRLRRVALGGESSSVEASLFGAQVTYTLGAPGRHLAQNSLAVIGAAHVLGVDMAAILPALAKFHAPKGRGERSALVHPSGPFTLIDESYNANPASMRAALALLAQASPQGSGRRIAVLGDMLELGDASPAEHRGLAEALQESGADLVFLAGPRMADLWALLPDRRRGAYAESAAELEPILLRTIGPGDVIMMKASLGTRLGPVVESIKRHFAAAAA